MSDIVEFLTARLDEDERLAREASAFYADDTPDGVSWNGHESEDLNGHMRYWIAPHLGVVNHVASGRHIGRHDPARVLREVKAKRALLRRLEEDMDGCTDDAEWRGASLALARVQEHLAAAWSDHPDYGPAWRVE